MSKVLNTDPGKVTLSLGLFNEILKDCPSGLRAALERDAAKHNTDIRKHYLAELKTKRDNKRVRRKEARDYAQAMMGKTVGALLKGLQPSAGVYHPSYANPNLTLTHLVMVVGYKGENVLVVEKNGKVHHVPKVLLSEKAFSGNDYKLSMTHGISFGDFTMWSVPVVTFNRCGLDRCLLGITLFDIEAIRSAVRVYAEGAGDALKDVKAHTETSPAKFSHLEVIETPTHIVIKATVHYRDSMAFFNPTSSVLILDTDKGQFDNTSESEEFIDNFNINGLCIRLKKPGEY